LNHLTKSKNIAIITPGFAINESDDFTIPALQEYIQGIKAYFHQWDITIFALHFPYTNAPYLYHGCKVIPFNGGNKKWKKIFTRNEFLRTFSQLHSKKRFDVIHSFWYDESTYLSQKLAAKFNLKHICSCYGQDVLSSNKYIKKIDAEKLELVYSTEFQKNKSVIKSHKVTHTIPCGIRNLPLSREEKSIHLINLGNLTTLKNQTLFIDVVKRLTQNHPNIKAVIAGEGPLYNELNEKIKREGLVDNIQLVGKQSRKKALQLLSKSKVLLHTSKYESFGMIYAEAQQAQCHIVTTPVGIALELTDAQKADTAEKLAKCVESVLTNEAPTIKNEFHIKKVVQKYAELY